MFGDGQGGEIDLENLGDRGFVIEGPSANAEASDPAGLGDVNGDGLDDIAIGAPGAAPNDQARGAVYIVFGKADTTSVHLQLFDADLQFDQGYRIDGPEFHAIAGEDVSDIGDVNDDGLADVLLSAPFAGATYIVFGQTSADPIDLRTFHEGTQREGYRIKTPSPTRGSSYSVGNAGDVNRDGIPDAIVGVVPTRVSSGSAYVVFGKRGLKPLNVRNLGDHGFRIKRSEEWSYTGYSSSGAGDVNGDGFDDVVVGAPYKDCCAKGRAYVIFGKKGSRPIDLEKLGRRGFKIVGAQFSNRIGSDSTGYAVDGVGDLNDDGLADVVIGAPFTTYHDRFVSGSAYVVYGKKGSRTVRLDQLGNGGFRIDGANKRDEMGESVAGLGGWNGEGSFAVLLGAHAAGPKTPMEIHLGLPTSSGE